MEKTFRSLSQDPWNKLKLYFCLRLIESHRDAVKQGRLFIELARIRKNFDPAMTLMLCEAALKTSPQDALVQRSVEEIVSVWLPKVGMRNLSQQDAVEPRAGAALQVVRPQQKVVNRQPGAQGLKGLQDQRKIMIGQLRSQLNATGIDGYVRELVRGKSVPENVLNDIEGFQANWQGMVQFIDYLKSKKALTEFQATAILEDMEQTLVLLEPQNPVIGRMRSMK